MFPVVALSYLPIFISVHELILLSPHPAVGKGNTQSSCMVALVRKLYYFTTKEA